MELEQLPSPLFPPPDMEKAMEELKCDVGVLQKKQALDARAQFLLRTKVACIKSEGQLAAEICRRETYKRENTFNVYNSTLGYDLSKVRVDVHRWRQRIALLQVKLTATEEDLERHRHRSEMLRRQCELEASAGGAMRNQNELLRKRVLDMQAAVETGARSAAGLLAELAAATRALEDSRAEMEQMKEDLQLTESQAQAELANVQAQCVRHQEQLVAAEQRALLAEQTAAAAHERANLAEQTLVQREALATERAQLQADVQGFSKDLAKMALETGNAANTQLQQAVAEAQATLFAERGARAEAEGRAAAAEARAAQLDREVARLERQVEAKGRRVGSLEDALRQREAAATPAREVSLALDAVGALVSQLEGTPGTDLAPPPPRPRVAAPQLAEAHAKGGKDDGGAAAGRLKARGGRKPKDVVAEVLSDDEDAGFVVSPEDASDPGFPGAAADGKGKKAADKGRKQTKGAEAGADASKLHRCQSRAAAADEKKAGLLRVAEEVAAGEEQAQRTQRAGQKRKEAGSAAGGKDDGGDPGGSRAAAAKKKKKKDQAKQPEVAAKDSLVGVWGDAENAPAAAGGRMEQRPLEALNPAVVAAAANQTRPVLPLKPAIQKSILARPPGGQGGTQQGKRRLLGVSSTNLATTMGDALPASMLFGGGFKVPKLQGK